MELHANTRTLGALLSENKKYVVPRFQREYSWTKDEVSVLWADICRQIKFTKGKPSLAEYFVGCLVLAGEDKSHALKIVDGQQRLTTITILLRALIKSLQTNGDSKSAKSLYENYIEGNDDEGHEFFKLENETPQAFFQASIQQLDQKQVAPATEEERLLRGAYDDLLSKMSEANLLPEFSDVPYKSKLAALRQQVLNNLKFIHILVSDEDHAYTIFETLNARGMNLSAMDLVKNWIFKHLPKEYPIDNAKLAWKQMSDELSSGPQAIDKDVFFRHYWLSRYSYVSEGRIYAAFRGLADVGKITAESFQRQLLDDAAIYWKLAYPNPDDYKSIIDKQIYDSLASLSLFRVSQVRPLLLALYHAKSQKRIQIKRYARLLKLLEDFHFAFTVISAARSSGLDGKYAKFARDIRNSTSATILEVLSALEEELQAKWPTLEVFRDGVARLWFTNDNAKDKKTIQYLFAKYEKHLRKTKELALGEISLEHIAPQSLKPLKEEFGRVGNLLPLCVELNGKAGSKSFIEKLAIYKDSDLKTVAEFAKLYRKQTKWDASLISRRTSAIAEVCYEKIWPPKK